MTVYELLQFTYLFALISSCGYAWHVGGRDERQGVIIIILGSVLSLPAASLDPRGWHAAELAVAAIDIAMLGCFLYLALRSDRFWPLWISGVLLAGILTHLMTLIGPELVPPSYALLQGFWAYPVLLIIVLGARGHHRRRLNRFPISF